MITTELWNGQGLGNQLACYVTTRCIALDKGYKWGIGHPERFKGASFMSLDFGEEVIGGITPIEGKAPASLPEGILNYYREKEAVNEYGADVRGYDEGLKNVPDNTKIDGQLQGEGYFGHRKKEIRKWLKVKPLRMSDNLCIINFRGGEYKYFPEFFLRQEYWDKAVFLVQSMRHDMEFEVVTDDIEEARKHFPSFFTFSHEMSLDYRKIRYARYLILSNSSFGWFPAWLNDKVKLVLAPKYWGRHNVSNGYWSLETNKTKGWWYVDRNGDLTRL